jgi:hypothetical protein
MAKHQDLSFERGSGSEKSDQPAPDQPPELVHRAEDSADSLPRANRIRFATGTGRPIQGGSKSGRNVTMSSTGKVRSRSTARLKTSRLVGSVQCTSSNVISTGFAAIAHAFAR